MSININKTYLVNQEIIILIFFNKSNNLFHTILIINKKELIEENAFLWSINSIHNKESFNEKIVGILVILQYIVYTIDYYRLKFIHYFCM